MKRKKILMVLVCMGLATSALAQPALSPSPTNAKVSISEPNNNAVVATTFTVKFALSGMELAPAGTQKENTGHHHLLVDMATLPELTQPLAVSDQIRHFGKGQTETTLTLTPGKHTLQLVLGDYEHVPHNKPLISEKITVNVK